MALMGLAAPAYADHQPEHADKKVSICHRTGDNEHYELIDIDYHAVVAAHSDHNHVGNGPDGDIIPAFTIGDTSYGGKNWTAEGQAILANGCMAVTTTPTPTETETTTPPPPTEHKVSLCHRTGAEGNPYVFITVDFHAIAGPNGHDGHNLVGNGPVGDIIPPFTFGDVVYEGKNWTAEGQAIFAAGCVVAAPTTTAPTTTPVPTITETVVVPGPTVVEKVPGGVVVQTKAPVAGQRGFNAQTAAGESEVMGNTAVVAGFALLAAAAGLAFYRRQGSRSH